jgi:hypothetical protein
MLHQFIAIFSVILPNAVARAQDAAPMSPEKERLVYKQRAEEEAKALPVARVAGPADLVRFSVKDNHLHIQTLAKPNDAERVRFEVPGMSGIIIAQIRGEQTDPAQPYLPEMLLLTKQDYSRPDAVIAITHISITPSQLAVACDTDFGDEMLNVQMHQSGQYLAEGEDMIHFRVNALREDTGQETVALHLTAPNIVELVRRYPGETSRYLEPIFDEWGQANVLFNVNPQTAWQVLGAGYESPAEMSAKVVALLKQLDAENPQARESAAAELKKLGQPAALVLMRQDRAKLSEEQKTQLDTFLAPYKPLPEEEAARMRGDAKFLLLCLGAEDAQLRKLALEQLKKVTRQPIEFDVNGDAKSRGDAVGKLRAKLIPPAASRPALSATQPVKAS